MSRKDNKTLLSPDFYFFGAGGGGGGGLCPRICHCVYFNLFKIYDTYSIVLQKSRCSEMHSILYLELRKHTWVSKVITFCLASFKHINIFLPK